MLRMDTDGPRIGKFIFLPMTGEAESIVVIAFGQLGSTGTPMGIVAIKAVDAGIKMFAPLKIKPLLVMSF